jgi:hypothetical protein
VVRRFPKLAKTFAIIGSVAALVETAIVFGTLAEPDFANMQLPDVNDQEHQDTANYAQLSGYAPSGSAFMRAHSRTCRVGPPQTVTPDSLVEEQLTAGGDVTSDRITAAIVTSQFLSMRH